MPTTDRDKLILLHIALFSLTTREVLSKLFFGGGAPNDVLTRLKREGLIQHPGSRTQYLQGHAYYWLTHKGAALIGAPRSRAEPPGPQALYQHLAVLESCCLTNPRFKKIEKERILALYETALREGAFGDSVPPDCPPPRLPRQAVFVAETGDAGKTVRFFEIYVPGASTKTVEIKKRMKRVIDERMKHPALRHWIGIHVLGFLVLVPGIRQREVLTGIKQVRRELRVFIRVEAFDQPTANEREAV